MELLIIIGVIVFLRFIAGRMTPDEANPEAPPLPSPPTRRRATRPRRDPLPFREEPETLPQAPFVAAPLPVALRPVLPSVAPRRALAIEFRGKDALRKAVIVREVLGPPLSLR